MNDVATADVKNELLKALPNFDGFDNPVTELSERELKYKRQASAKKIH